MVEFVFSGDGVRKVQAHTKPETISMLRRQWQQFADDIDPYPDHFSGRGIVICAGGISYLTCAWINITLLRKHGCQLPIEIWHTANELTPQVTEALKQLQVTCINCRDYPGGNVENYALKPFALLNTRFKEVMYLDADNNCVVDPTYLFEDAGYKATGTMFWPDFWNTEKTNPIWEIVGSTEYDLIEQESGQILINKEKCWRELNLCMYFNLNKQYYYRILLGDKDTFKFSWLALRSPFTMITTPVGFAGFCEPDDSFHGLTMVQHDPAGNIIFLHRNWLKWDVTLQDEKVWHQIKRFKQPDPNRIFTFQFVEKGGVKLKFWDIQGDVECHAFEDLLGNFEQQCLDVLKELRKADWYTRFLLHNYFMHYRLGYSSHTGKIFTGTTQNIVSDDIVIEKS